MLSSHKWVIDMEVMADGTVKPKILRQKDLKLEKECATIDSYKGFHYTSSDDASKYGRVAFDGNFEIDDEGHVLLGDE